MSKIELRIEGLNQEETLKYQEVLVALISCGGLSGVKGGQTIIHFDERGVFQGIELKYWPWRRKKVELNAIKVRSITAEDEANLTFQKK